MAGKETIIYEIGYLLKTSLGDEKALNFVEKLRNIIIEKGGLTISEGKTKKQKLAYPVKDGESAFFNWINFSLSPEKIKEIKNFLDKESEVLRFLIMKSKKEEPAIASILPRAKKLEKLETKEKTPAEIKPLIDAPKDPEDLKTKEEEIDKKLEELLGN